MNQVARWREECRSSRREHELFRVQSDQCRGTLEKEITSLKALNESAAVEYKNALSLFVQQPCKPADDQLKMLSRLEVELNKVTITNAELRKEIEEMYNTKEREDNARNELLSVHHEKSMVNQQS